MREYLQYEKLIFKKVFKLRFEASDFLSGLSVAIMGAIDHFKPELGLDMELLSWQAPLIALGAAFAIRIITAPYFIWREQNEKCKELSKNSNSMQIGFYSKQVGYLYSDLIENWNVDGIKTHALLEGIPRSFQAYIYLDEIAPTMILSEETRKDLQKFLSFFLINRTILASVMPAIKTIFESKKEVLKQKNEIKSLAEKLTMDLKNVAKPKEE